MRGDKGDNVKQRKCAFCKNMVDKTNWDCGGSDKPEQHEKSCPIREMIEVRQVYSKKFVNEE